MLLDNLFAIAGPALTAVILLAILSAIGAVALVAVSPPRDG